ncbi:MAG: hypothetical protein CSA09_00415 [Candidatus Contendobacter odensis]|uniref:Bacterial CdiA-CT RNAse A domain-containing protein n=1 Tax=Candidatus Contendibacter odensensis TaxID=1400860 RepID=A0A2G6PGS4_9GAMM|nr:MAG: hypothetical protein CSA09_00415 [Candidatus Contendobacter odensis]
MEEGLEIVLTPLQFAAVLENDSIEESSSWSNRFWGAATVVGGALEMVGGAALLLTPEPTTVTKIAGGALAVHGADTTSTGIMQVVSGRTRTTLTSQAVAAAAKALGADPQTASNVAFAVDIAVPLVAGFAGAARVIAIRRGAITLAAEEAAGGHTIARHVGRTEAQLRSRLAQQPNIPAASTFRTLQEAERAVAAALRANKEAIKTWAKSANPGQTKAFTYEAGQVIGQGVVRSTGQMTNMSKMVVVVRKVIEQNRVYFVLTAYPKP